MACLICNDTTNHFPSYSVCCNSCYYSSSSRRSRRRTFSVYLLLRLEPTQPDAALIPHSHPSLLGALLVRSQLSAASRLSLLSPPSSNLCTIVPYALADFRTACNLYKEFFQRIQATTRRSINIRKNDDLVANNEAKL